MKPSRIVLAVGLSFLLAAVVGVMSIAPAWAGATSVKVPFAAFVFVPCANGGAGEVVDLGGTLHIVSHVHIDGNGGFHSKIHFQPQGISGLGLVTGDKYRGTGVTQQSVNIQGDGLPFESTFVNNFRIIGQGPGNNLLVHQNVHVTINNNGVLTANVNNSSVECR